MTKLSNQDVKFSAVIAAAGSSRRMGNLDKLLVDLEGKPVIVRTLDVFEKNPRILEIILVLPCEKINLYDEILKRFDIRKVNTIVEGGEKRQDSVYNGLLKVKTKCVAIHDGARPLLTGELLDKLMDSLEGETGCIPVIPVRDTVKVVGKQNFIIDTPDRNKLFLAQTPQVFTTNVILEAYEAIIKKNITVTDDASAMEYFGYKVKVIGSFNENIKITTPEDIEIARFFLKIHPDKFNK